MVLREQLDEWFEKGIVEGYTHMIIACDEFDEDDDDHGSYPIYINDHYEDLNAMISTAMLKPMQHVHEVYALWLNKKLQLRKSTLVWNNMPSPRPKSITVLSCGCEIPWKVDHRKTVSLLNCRTHGPVAVQLIK